MSGDLEGRGETGSPGTPAPEKRSPQVVWVRKGFGLETRVLEKERTLSGMERSSHLLSVVGYEFLQGMY